MIQELLGGGAGLIGGERKISISGVLEGSPSPSLSPSPSPSPSPTTASGVTTTTSETLNLRCPRCDSSNTKFCYYNNYNLTQPRHFCKTCRRYWTKGGALRNVPIGGGCRKNKNICSVTTTTTTSAGKSSGTGRFLKTNTFSSPSDHNQMGKSSGLFEEMIPSNPIMWASPQSSHLLAFLRANQNPNPNPISSNSVHVKEESVMIGSHMNLNPFNHFPNSTSLCSSSPFWRSNQQQQQAALQQQNHFVVGSGGGGGEFQNTGSFQDMYQRMKSTTSPANYYLDHHHHQQQSPVLLSNVGSSSLSSSSSTILESAPVASSEMNYWNTTLSWTDLPTATNSAYPN